MDKKNLGKILNVALENAEANGIIPTQVLENKNPDWDQVRRTLSKWEETGKVICIQKRYPSNNGKYVLIKYSEVIK